MPDHRMTFRPAEHPHRRYNSLTGEWVLVSPHRTRRPWQGQVERPPQQTRPAYDPSCYLCPGNRRAGGIQREQRAGIAAKIKTPSRDGRLIGNTFGILINPKRQPAALVE